MSPRIIFPMIILLGSLATALAASPQKQAIEVDTSQVTTWNRFSDQVFDLHKRQMAGRAIRQSSEKGEYGGAAAKGYGFIETSYYDAGNGQLLSRVRVDRDRPEILHIVEVFIYDPQGRVLRDYATIYLPFARNSPIRTMINLHQYNDGLHAYRQFDATGNRIYEQCKGTLAGAPVEISLELQDFRPVNTTTSAYKTCFAGAQESAGAYLQPK